MLSRDDIVGMLVNFPQVEVVKFIMNIQENQWKLIRILDEYDRWLDENIGICRLNQKYDKGNVYAIKEDTYYNCRKTLDDIRNRD